MAEQQRHRARIAVVNDDTPFLQLMHELLGDMEGYEVHGRKEWEGAYDFVKALQPDLVILDIMMGREERGWQLLELLRLDPKTRPIPVVVCSAAIRSLQEREEVLRQHDVRPLPKPFDLDDLLSIIREALAGRPGSPGAHP
jgi:CheY-like chemotaxis protein